MTRRLEILYSQKVAPYVFILPFILLFIVFFIYPIISTIVMSFQSILPGQVEFIGLKNYRKLLFDPTFWASVRNSVVYMVLTLIVLVPIPMVLACLLDSKLVIGKELFRGVFFVPVLTSVVVSGTIFRLLFGELPGSLMNRVIQIFGHEPIKWLFHYPTGYFALILLALWRWTGMNIVYFFAGLKIIPEELYEAADIDGASGFQSFIRITVPMLRPSITYVITISIFAGLRMFTESYMLWNGNNSPYDIGLTMVGYLYRQGIEQNAMGYASAVGLLLLALAMTLNLSQLKASGFFKKEHKND
ncbi:carbohydrate ABC transporter permease [Sediminispirochaeta smaragdinae]|uniref:Binding-protein-dependent transport systems inner membrane component n=1 Tax=Sediminispirochaeta smaragdinae (strain DSM 11293 / JCM 15392 / SEBR 4228) TaxID=573413 RepID=E1R620_SEDSS|nr:sugar ABC transporter permease [Sediminispirochaeta smaragdinae]ADK80785.1 binding-protein-dependent transport systems inner membrane component [Sediminispirochaeta smaragdinae DSM 11293]